MQDSKSGSFDSMQMESKPGTLGLYIATNENWTQGARASHYQWTLSSMLTQEPRWFARDFSVSWMLSIVSNVIGEDARMRPDICRIPVYFVYTIITRLVISHYQCQPMRRMTAIASHQTSNLLQIAIDCCRYTSITSSLCTFYVYHCLTKIISEHERHGFTHPTVVCLGAALLFVPKSIFVSFSSGSVVSFGIW